MSFSIVLGIHIIGAVATLLVVLYAMCVLILGNHTAYRRVALILSTLATFEILTGVALAALSRDITVTSLCNNIVLYILFVAVIETALFTRMKSASLPFPALETLSPIGGGIILLLIGAVLGL